MPTLKEIRIAKGLSMGDVEKATGLHNTTISKVERGIINFTPRLYQILSEFYGTTDIDDEVKGSMVVKKKETPSLVENLDVAHEFIVDDFQALRNARKKLGLTLKQVGTAVGLDPSTVSHYERGSKAVIVETYNRLANFYNLEPKLELAPRIIQDKIKSDLIRKKIKKQIPVREFADRELVEKIISLRQQCGYTQTQAAKILGIGSSSVSEYESGARRLPLDRVGMFIALYTGQMFIPDKPKDEVIEKYERKITNLRNIIYKLQLEVAGLKKRLRQSLQMEEHIISVIIKLKDNYIKAVTKITDIEKDYKLNELWEFSMNPIIDLGDEDDTEE